MIQLATYMFFKILRIAVLTGTVTIASAAVADDCNRFAEISTLHPLDRFALESAFGGDVIDWTDEQFQAVKNELIACAAGVPALQTIAPDFAGQYLDEALNNLRGHVADWRRSRDEQARLAAVAAAKAEAEAAAASAAAASAIEETRRAAAEAAAAEERDLAERADLEKRRAERDEMLRAKAQEELAERERRKAEEAADPAGFAERKRAEQEEALEELRRSSNAAMDDRGLPRYSELNGASIPAPDRAVMLLSAYFIADICATNGIAFTPEEAEGYRQLLTAALDEAQMGQDTRDKLWANAQRTVVSEQDCRDTYAGLAMFADGTPLELPPSKAPF